jgi:uncharacterized Tic20 family protein
MSDESAPTPPPMEDPSASIPPVNSGLPAPGQGKMSQKDDQTFGMLSHLLGALTSFVGPLVIWLVKREESPFVEDQGKEALNFQVTVLIGYVVSIVLSFIPFISCVTVLLFPALWITSLVFGIIGCVEANKGTVYRYPFSARFIS